jgi:hypothetical protein
MKFKSAEMSFKELNFGEVVPNTSKYFAIKDAVELNLQKNNLKNLLVLRAIFPGSIQADPYDLREGISKLDLETEKEKNGKSKDYKESFEKINNWLSQGLLDSGVCKRSKIEYLINKFGLVKK